MSSHLPNDVLRACVLTLGREKEVRSRLVSPVEERDMAQEILQWKEYCKSVAVRTGRSQFKLEIMLKDVVSGPNAEAYRIRKQRASRA